jgi:phenylacetate-CoA ligase
MIPVGVVGRLLFPLHERLKGKPTFEWLRRLERTQWLPADRLRAYQADRLQALITYACERVPYYQELFSAHGLAPSTIKGPDDLHQVPPMTRALLREHFDRLCARPLPRRVQRMATGGSTGAPVTILVDMQRMGFTEGARLRAHRWFGLPPGVPEVVLWASPIEVRQQDRLRSLRDKLLNSRLLSAFDLGEPALKRYAAYISRVEPHKMYGYASALYLLARYAEAVGWRPPASLRAVFATAEPLFDFQRATIEAAFRCRVATEYGARDGGLIANECPARGLHIPIEGMHVEILGDRGDGVGEIVVTVLDSFAFPIIRYRTGDLGSLTEDVCPCGRTLPRLRAVEGRRTDFLVTPDGRCVHALAIIYPLRESPRLRQFRVVQDTVDHVTVMVVTEPSFSTVDEGLLRRRIGAALGDGVAIDVMRVEEIDPTPSGKFRYVTSRVADAYIETMLAQGRPA